MNRRRKLVKPPAKSRKSRPVQRKRAIQVTKVEHDESLDDGKIRINRFLALAGVCSRRAAEGLVRGGAVAINGEVVRELATRIDPVHDEVRCEGSVVRPEKPVYLLFNKPKGVVCTNAQGEHRRRVIDFLPPQCGRVFTVGRLDADSEGLVLVTNDGQFAQRMAHPSHGIAKTYAVLVRGRVAREKLDKVRGGVWLSDGKTAESKITIERLGRDRTYLKVSLREGRNREIRRIFAKIDHSVISLKRVRIGPLSLHGLGRGRYRFLSTDEVKKLEALASA